MLKFHSACTPSSNTLLCSSKLYLLLLLAHLWAEESSAGFVYVWNISKASSVFTSHFKEQNRTGPWASHLNAFFLCGILLFCSLLATSAKLLIEGNYILPCMCACLVLFLYIIDSHRNTQHSSFLPLQTYWGFGALNECCVCLDVFLRPKLGLLDSRNSSIRIVSLWC